MKQTNKNAETHVERSLESAIWWTGPPPPVPACAGCQWLMRVWLMPVVDASVVDASVVDASVVDASA